MIRRLPDRIRGSLHKGLLISFLLFVTAVVAIANLSSEVVEGDTLAFDRWVIEHLRDPLDLGTPRAPAWVTRAMIDLTSLGGGPFLTLLTVCVAGYLIAARKLATAIFTVVAIASGGIAGTLLKMLFERPRPDIVPHLVSVGSASFPSAHAMNSAVTFLTLGAMLSSTFEERRLKIYVMAVALLLTLIVGVSRVYLGVHWPTDVAAGWMVGATWALACSFIARILQRRHTIEAPDE